MNNKNNNKNPRRKQTTKGACGAQFGGHSAIPGDGLQHGREKASGEGSKNHRSWELEETKASGLKPFQD